MEWRLRLRLFDGSVRVGGYVGAKDQVYYIADELSGEVHTIPCNLVEDFDTQKY